MEIEIKPVTSEMRFGPKEAVDLLPENNIYGVEGLATELTRASVEEPMRKQRGNISSKHLWWIITLSFVAGIGVCVLRYKMKKKKEESIVKT